MADVRARIGIVVMGMAVVAGCARENHAVVVPVATTAPVEAVVKPHDSGSKILSYRVEMEKIANVVGPESNVEQSRSGLRIAVSLAKCERTWSWIRSDGERWGYFDSIQICVDGVMGPVFEETWSRGNGSQAIFSPDERHYAYTGKRDGKFVVMLDQQAIWEGAEEAGMIQFSPDGKRLAFLIFGKGKEVLMVDGKEVWRDSVISNFCFSPNGEHYAVVVERNSKQIVIRDGKESPACDGVWDMTFSDDGSRFSFRGKDWDGVKQRYFVMSDGEKMGPYTWISSEVPVYSRDGKHFSFVTERNGKSILVTDGKEIVVDGQLLWHSKFGEGTLKIAYLSKTKGKRTVVVDGRANEAFDEIGENQFQMSADGKHYVYVARNGKKEYVVHDGRLSIGYELGELQTLTIQMSADGTRWTYVVNRGGEDYMVVDGREEEIMGLYSEVYSPDGKHMAHFTRRRDDGGLWRLVLDGKEQDIFVGSSRDYVLNEPRFSPDSEHIVCGEKRRVFLDGVAGPEGDEVIYPRQVFGADGTLRYCLVKGGVLYRVRHVPVRG